MDTTKKMLRIFLINTLVMLISWAGSSLILFGVRVFTSPQAGLVKILSIHSYVVAMFFYAFYLIFDLCQYCSTQSGFEKMKGRMLEESTKRHLESKRFLHLVFTRVIKVIAVCLALTLIVWLLWIGKFTFGSFLAGAAIGFLVFLILSFLKRHLGYQKAKESSDVTEEVGKLTDPEEIRPKAPVED
ncbi:unnamed protein product [marine sediment metagenome]|uniref:Uncharacterized protein n=1 Tax=marine sediment metagenome TaxID=412755 RepID=X0U6Z4_9ZZZZ